MTGVTAAVSAAVVFEEEVGLLLLLLALLLLSELPNQDRLTDKWLFNGKKVSQQDAKKWNASNEIKAVEKFAAFLVSIPRVI